MSSRTLVAGVAATLVLTSVLIKLFYLLRIGTSGLPPQLVELALTCLLAFSLLQGSGTARWIAVILPGIGGVGGIIAGISLLSRTAGGGVAMIALGLVYLACAVALLTPTAAEHFE